MPDVRFVGPRHASPGLLLTHLSPVYPISTVLLSTAAGAHVIWETLGLASCRRRVDLSPCQRPTLPAASGCFGMRTWCILDAVSCFSTSFNLFTRFARPVDMIIIFLHSIHRYIRRISPSMSPLSPPWFMRPARRNGSSSGPSLPTVQSTVEAFHFPCSMRSPALS